MTAENDYNDRTTDKTLGDLHQLGTSIDGKVEEILEELRDLVEFERDRSYHGYSLNDY
ncbi:hypothetical protein ACFL34_04880 [Candidatus Sumerlaeota bacterium]